MFVFVRGRGQKGGAWGEGGEEVCVYERERKMRGEAEGKGGGLYILSNHSSISSRWALTKDSRLNIKTPQIP